MAMNNKGPGPEILTLDKARQEVVDQLNPSSAIARLERRVKEAEVRVMALEQANANLSLAIAKGLTPAMRGLVAQLRAIQTAFEEYSGVKVPEVEISDMGDVRVPGASPEGKPS